MMRLITLILVLFAAVGTAQAHESRPAYLELRETTRGAYDVYWKKPAGGIADTITLTLQFPHDCRDLTPRSSIRKDGAWSQRWSMTCDSPLAGRSIGKIGRAHV